MIFIDNNRIWSISGWVTLHKSVGRTKRQRRGLIWGNNGQHKIIIYGLIQLSDGKSNRTTGIFTANGVT